MGSACTVAACYAVLYERLPEGFQTVQVSFHKYGDNFFPGTGACGDIGYAKGAGYSVNVPLRDGMDDESYKFIFEPVMKKVLDVRCALLLAAYRLHLSCERRAAACTDLCILSCCVLMYARRWLD